MNIKHIETSIRKREEKRGDKIISKNIPWPLIAPTEFNINDKRIKKIAFCLSKIKSGTALEVTNELLNYESGLVWNEEYTRIKQLLNRLYNFGSIEGHQQIGRNIIKYKLAPVV